MGHPKPLLVLGGKAMVERQVGLLSRVCCDVAVVGMTPGVSHHAICVFPDLIPHRGPLGGIFTSLLRTQTEYNLVVGCDLPFLDIRFLDLLARRALLGDADVTVPEDKWGTIQPLCAIYRRRARRVIRCSLERGENKTSGFFSRVRCHKIPWREIARAGYSSLIFGNMNTPADYEAAKRVMNYGC